jgi:aspartate carbamoyltransferase catalytic subunit
VFLKPLGTSVPEDLVETMAAGGLAWRTAESAGELLAAVNAVSVIPFHLSDFHQTAVHDHVRSSRLDERFVFSRRLLSAHPGVPLVHCGPRGPELPREADELPNMHYFEAVGKGILVRAALMAHLLGRI